MKQTRQAVCPIKQSIFLDVYEYNSKSFNDLKNSANSDPAVINTVGHYETELITAVKVFTVEAPDFFSG
jgi:hypothetical protein